MKKAHQEFKTYNHFEEPFVSGHRLAVGSFLPGVPKAEETLRNTDRLIQNI
jgi:hypothetical protein